MGWHKRAGTRGQAQLGKVVVWGAGTHMVGRHQGGIWQRASSRVDMHRHGGWGEQAGRAREQRAGVWPFAPHWCFPHHCSVEDEFKDDLSLVRFYTQKIITYL